MATLSQMKKGLSLRPTYDQILLSYLSGGPDIKKPDRTAKFIRESPQYQDLLKTDFIDLQKQQNNILIAQKRDVLIKEMASSSDSDMKSVKSSVNGNGNGNTAYYSLESDVESLNSHDKQIADTIEDLDDFFNEYNEEQKRKIEETGKKLIQDHLNEVKKDAERAIGREEKYAAAQATGYEPVPPLAPNTFFTKWDKQIAEGQRLDVLRVLPASSSNPPYISELSKNPANVERQRLRMGLPASSSTDLIAERRKYLESLSIQRLKAEAKAAALPYKNMRKRDMPGVIDDILYK